MANPFGYEISPGVFKAAGCHHRRGHLSACGACYARVVDTLTAILKRPDRAAAIAKKCMDAVRAERLPKKATRRA